MKNRIMLDFIKFLFLFLCIVVVGIFLLMSVSFLPQEKIRKHVQESCVQMNIEGDYPRIYDYESATNQLDNYTDSLILLESYYLNNSWEAIWKNPIYTDIQESRVKTLDYVSKTDVSANRNYSRYWGGFRVIYRMLLFGLNITEIRRLLSILFFLLFLSATYTFFEHGGIITAVVFYMSILFVKPEIISNSMQFSCCFILAFIFVTLMPKVARKSKNVIFYFFIIGCLTQYLDFYTTPLLTFGIPFCLYLIIQQNDSLSRRYLMLLKSAISWLLGYLFMWLAKLMLTEIFSDENAFLLAFSSVAKRIGINKIENMENTYTILSAFSTVWNVFLQSLSFLVLLILLGLILIIICLQIRKKRACNEKSTLRESFLNSSVFLIVALLPFAWFAIAASPTIIHSWFQYRTIVITIFAFPMFIAYGLSPPRKE